MRDEKYRYAGCLVGTCNMHVDGKFSARCRCWLDLERSEFAVEDSDGTGMQAGEDRITFHDLTFHTQNGEIHIAQLSVSFPRYRPFSGGSNHRDSQLSRTFDFLTLAPIWRFICNNVLEFQTTFSGEEIFFRPGEHSWVHVDLACGGQLVRAEFGLCVRNSPNFGAAHHVALEVALGCPLSECARLSGNRLTLWLNNWNPSGSFRRFHDATSGGMRNHDMDSVAISKVYKAALEFQKMQPDGGKAFGLAVQAFLESRSQSLGFTLKILAVMQMLEWLDGEITINVRNLVVRFGIPDGAARAMMILRNEISHNHHDQRRGRDLSSSVEKACASLEQVGINLADIGNGNREIGLLNYHFSLVGRILLEKINACDSDVIPTHFIPGHGRFQY